MNKSSTPQVPPAAAPRRAFLQGLAALGLVAAAPVASAGAAKPKAAPAGKRPLIIDVLGSISNPNLPDAEQEDRYTMGIDARAMADAKASGLSAFNMTIGYVFGKEDPYEQTVKEVAEWDAFLRRRQDSLIKVLSASDIQHAHDSGRIGVILGFQNAAMMGKNAARVDTFANLGVRVIQLTYNDRNQLGDGCLVPENQGLTPFGHEVVDALNRNRVIVDLSHSGEQICLDAARASKAPIMITHTGCRALVDLPRNKTDQELRLVADKGGFVGIYMMPFLAIGRQPTAADLIAHIEHAINVCGEDHVGIGTDGTLSKIDDIPGYLADLKKEVARRRSLGISAPGERDDIVPFLPDLGGQEKFLKLADLLARRGHTSARIEKILGRNFLRAAGRIWA
ncbi:dipeptidase [Janthinobacterium agaricidamnosum]|nr:membrane dipeptidase [Janthinobacterium agaricidamnosum]